MLRRTKKQSDNTTFFSTSSGFVPKDIFVVVGGLSTGKHIAPLLRGHGYSVVHVQPKRAEALGIKQNEADYIAHFSEGDDLDALIAALSQFTIRAIIPGCEAGVHLADILNEHFCLESRNDFSKSECRSNKYLMQEAIRAAGIRAVEQTIVNKLEPLLEWVQSNGLPVVLKPEESAGTDGVYICESEEQVVKAFKQIMSKRSVHGFENQHVVAQDMLIGDEFMVNTVSSGDDIIVTEIILGKKKVLKDAPLYDYALTLGMQNPLFEQISAYVKQVLPALGFRYGAAHTEVIVTSKGPTLVEVNCRLTGAFDMSAITDATGTNQVDALVNSYVKPGYVAMRARADILDYPQTMLTGFFIVEEGRDITHSPDLQMFADIPGFHSIKFGPKLGSKLPVTTSLMDSPGMVSFVGKDTAALFESLKAFREREHEFYAKACVALLLPQVEEHKADLVQEIPSVVAPFSAAPIGAAGIGLSVFSPRTDEHQQLGVTQTAFYKA